MHFDMTHATDADLEALVLLFRTFRHVAPSCYGAILSALEGEILRRRDPSQARARTEEIILHTDGIGKLLQAVNHIAASHLAAKRAGFQGPAGFLRAVLDGLIDVAAATVEARRSTVN
jgi:hypothetical protein